MTILRNKEIRTLIIIIIIIIYGLNTSIWEKNISNQKCFTSLTFKSVNVIRQLERLQRQAARVVCKKYKNDHTSVTELMWGLHWLPIRARIQYKILLLVYKAFTNGSPTYLADMMTSCNPVRSTRSSHKVNLLVVPHQKSNKYSEKAFAVVGPRLWNELLTDELRGCNSVDTFKKKLKTMLFKKHY